MERIIQHLAEIWDWEDAALLHDALHMVHLVGERLKVGLKPRWQWLGPPAWGICD